jgi:hypothetical protein
MAEVTLNTPGQAMARLRTEPGGRVRGHPVARFLFRRVLGAILTLFVVSILIFEPHRGRVRVRRPVAGLRA